MRIRGRRVVLLIAGALPLLAVDDNDHHQDDVVSSMGPQQQRESLLIVDDDDEQPQQQQEEEYDNTARTVRQPQRHPTGDADDNVRLSSLPPLNLLQVEADLLSIIDGGGCMKNTTNKHVWIL